MKTLRFYLLVGFVWPLFIVSCDDSSTSADQSRDLTIRTNSISLVTSSTAESGGNITDDGGSAVTARGVCWSTSENPTNSDDCTSDGGGSGQFTSIITNLAATTQYFVRAYATNINGTTFGNQLTFTTEAPRDNVTVVVEVTNPVTGKIWMDRNLGASRVATSSTDTEAYGDLYQWGRAADGHEKRNSPNTTNLSDIDNPGHGFFILSSFELNDEWRSPQNNDLWQGTREINNPCPRGYRLPTEAEWQAERHSWSSDDAAGAFASPLKLPMAGYRLNFEHPDNGIVEVGIRGRYWTSTVTNTSAISMGFTNSTALGSTNGRAFGFSVRCIKS